MDSTAYMDKLTDDLLVAIISYLPFNYAARCKYVDKRFEALISHHPFCAKPITLLFHFSSQSPKIFYNIPLNPPPMITLGPEVTLPLIASISDSCLGLILLQFPHHKLLCVSNPLTKAYHIFPYPTDFVAHAELETDTVTGWSSCGHPHAGLIVNSTTTFKCPNQYKVVAIGERINEFWQVQYEFHIFSPSTNSWKKLCTSSPYRNSKLLDGQGPPIYLEGSGCLHWLRAYGDIVAVDTHKESCRIISKPRDLEFGSTTKLGVSQGRMVLISALKQDIVIRDLYDYENNRWRVRTRIPTIATPMNNDYWNGIPVSFDHERLLFQIRACREDGEIHAYDMSTNVWTKMGLVDRKMDCIQVFVPYVPTFAKVSTLVGNVKLPDKIIESISELNNLVSVSLGAYGW